MPEQPDAFAVAKIHELCEQLATRHGLDQQTKEELCGHLEDKLHGYLTGEIRIGEEDALLLVRAHFGDADRVCAMLGTGGDLHELRFSGRRRAMLWIAAVTAALTLLALPTCALGLGVSVGSTLAIAGWMAVFETGVLLAARADSDSLWQRAVAVFLLLPTTGLLYLLLTEGTGPLTMHIPAHYAEARLAMSATVALSLLGHLALLTLLVRPRSELAGL
ncbi:MAG TPA: hypothetical protein VK797_21715 [Tepidisphaeraceae bacterium]|jgi:hypothetical protein|nr:hypothetical protein [Tepidisphaeraceae bacterium]